MTCLHTNQSRSYLNHLVFRSVFCTIIGLLCKTFKNKGKGLHTIYTSFVRFQNYKLFSIIIIIVDIVIVVVCSVS